MISPKQVFTDGGLIDFNAFVFFSVLMSGIIGTIANFALTPHDILRVQSSMEIMLGVSMYSIIPFILFTSNQTLLMLKDGDFKRVEYFWYFFIPGFNILICFYLFVFGLCEGVVNRCKFFVDIYKKQSEKEYESMLKDMLDNSKKINENIRKAMAYDSSQVNQYTIAILEETYKTARIMKGELI